MKINDLEKVTKLEREYYELVEAIGLLKECDAAQFYKIGYQSQIFTYLRCGSYETTIKEIKEVAIKGVQFELDKVIEKLKELGVEA